MVLFGLGSVAYFCLLLINSIAILNKERFLVPLGLTTNHSIPGSGTATPSGVYGQNQYDAYSGQIGAGPGEDGLKSRLVQLVDAVRTLMRSELGQQQLACIHELTHCPPVVPLIPINILVIVYELILG